MRIRPGTLIVAGLALMGPAWALATEGDGFAVSWDVKRVVLTLPALLLGIGLHEWAHAYVAVRLGDSLPEEDGRLSLNPLDHFDPLGGIIILGAMIWHLPLLGWGKPVMIRGSAFRNPIKDKMKVALAGPLMNLAVVAGTLVVVHLFQHFRAPILEHLGKEFAANTAMMLSTILLTNASLALFNMIPIAPLDGSKVLENFVSARTVYTMREYEPYGYLILFGLINTPLLAVPFGFMSDGVGIMMTQLGPMLVFSVAVALAWLAMIRSLRRI